MVDFINRHKTAYGVGSICRILPIAPSSCYRHQRQHPQQRSRRCLQDEQRLILIRDIWEQRRRIYGARKVWRALLRDGHRVARCTVERLMRRHQMQGVWRGKGKRTTVHDPQLQRAGDLVKRQFNADSPNRLWVADFTCVATHQGFVYTAFVIDVFARRIVGRKVSKRMDTDMVMDAPEQALYARRPKEVIHHSDRGSQYLSIRYTERLRQSQVKTSAGTTGNSYDNALAETINGLYKAEVIHHQRPWRGIADVEWATLEWADWFNHHRLLGSIGYVPPAEYEMAYYRQLEGSANAA